MEKTANKEFIKKARQVHGNKYDYSKVNYINNQTKIIIICPEHGEFLQTPNHHLRGCNCSNCVAKNTPHTLNDFIKKSSKLFNNKYDYSKVNIINSKIKVIIICPEHGEFEQNYLSHLNGNGCSKCHFLNISIKKTMSLEQFIEKAKAIHGNKYDYKNSKYISTKHKVNIVCPTHGEFIQSANSHLQGVGCNRCKESKGELAIANILDKYNIKYIREYRIPNQLYRFRYDFYLPDHNLLIEFHGGQHFKPIAYFGGDETFKYIQKNDMFKRSLAKELGYKMIELNYKHFRFSKNKFEKIILNKINLTLKGNEK